jgi:uncharacterized OB-fold protein
MTDVLPDAPAKAIPEPDERSLPFFAGAAREELMLQRCAACETWCWPVRARCIACFADALEWTAASGRGAVHSHTWVHHTSDPAFAAEAPFNVVLVDLDEGVRIFSTVIGVAHGSLAIGARVHVVFEQLSPDVTVPKFARDD